MLEKICHVDGKAVPDFDDISLKRRFCDWFPA